MVDAMGADDRIVHLRHPNPIPLLTVTKTVAKILRLPMVPYAQWVERLESEAGRVARGECTPSPQLEAGLRLLDIFRTGIDHPSRQMMDCFGLMCKLNIERALATSVTLRSPDLPQISEADVVQWVAHWREVGFLVDAKRK